ncbi:hypothetical protein [Mycolicibacterium arenosum]|uniref:PPE family protein n=1 Tax=Mycolicibacterium arenosum TaxID=2952157 RepID=A0ABT1LWP0_9MYCO|nr:hypothetical protein [Mycolicibacterium sp. CAU 1645]MCP9271308.1 hypothetical protein [Mycolicibacterium sp. CAU 1645]
MGIPRDVSPYGSQTVTGPAWPNVEEEQLAAAAAQYDALAAKLTGSVVPEQTSQLMSMTDSWRGLGAVGASGEATRIIGGHEANAAQAAATAMKLRAMEVTVAKTKMLVNATATEVQQECMALQAMAAVVSNTQELIESRIKMGLSQNIAYVNANTAELAATLGTPPVMHDPGAPPTASAQQAGQKGAEQSTQMMGQMLSMATQLPGQLMGMATQAPQQLMQPLQQLSQPLQQLTSMFGGKGGGASSPSPFSAFSNHPLAGGSGAGGGGGMTKAASVPGSGGVPAQTSLMGNLVGSAPTAAAAVGAGGGGVAGLAPVGAGVGGGGMGMMPHRGAEGGGGTAASLAPPPALDYDVDEDTDDDW